MDEEEWGGENEEEKEVEEGGRKGGEGGTQRRVTRHQCMQFGLILYDHPQCMDNQCTCIYIPHK